MCGIFAWADPEGPPGNVVGPVLRSLAHRGPDGHGVHSSPGVLLLHTRLAVIDVSGGRQPLANEDGGVWVTFNGEIYNFKELRAGLEARGHRFATASDTEVLVHLYEDEGEAFLPRLNGMFAFALWDAKKRVLLAARDRFGVKPLYMARVGDGLALASECKALIAAMGRAPRPDPVALDSFFTHRFVKGPETAFADIACVPPGRFVRWQDGRTAEGSFFDPLAQPPGPAMDPAEAVEEYRRLLLAAVDRQLMSDVPLGMFLSGGLDSGTVCAAMAARGTRPRTFTVGFENQADERDQAGRIAAHAGAEHHAFTVGLSDLELLPRLQWHLDNPFGDAIILPTFVLAREARRTVTVALTGEGADETLGGYIHQKALWRLSRTPLASGPWMGLVARAVSLLPVPWLDRLFEYPASMGPEGRLRLADLLRARGDVERYFTFVSLFSPQEKARLYTPAMAEAARRSRDRERTAAILSRRDLDPFQRLILAELTTWLADNILFKIDKICMACGLEGRFPFLDNDLAGFALGLPRAMKLRGGVNKFVLRRAAEALLPGLVDRGKKAFYFSVAAMFPEVYAAWLDTVLTRRRVERTGLVRWDFVRDLKERQRRPTLLGEKQLLSLVCFVEWHDRYFA